MTPFDPMRNFGALYGGAIERFVNANADPGADPEPYTPKYDWASLLGDKQEPRRYRPNELGPQQTSVRERLLPAFRRYEEQYGLPHGLLERVAYQESGMGRDRGDLSNPDRAQGLMQIIPGIHGPELEQLGLDHLNDEDAIAFAGRYLGKLHNQFGNIEDALAAYNAGQGRVRRAGGIPEGFTETQHYVGEILQDLVDQFAFDIVGPPTTDIRERLERLAPDLIESRVRADMVRTVLSDAPGGEPTTFPFGERGRRELPAIEQRAIQADNLRVGEVTGGVTLREFTENLPGGRALLRGTDFMRMTGTAAADAMAEAEAAARERLPEGERQSVLPASLTDNLAFLRDRTVIGRSLQASGQVAGVVASLLHPGDMVPGTAAFVAWSKIGSAKTITNSFKANKVASGVNFDAIDNTSALIAVGPNGWVGAARPTGGGNYVGTLDDLHKKYPKDIIIDYDPHTTPEVILPDGMRKFEAIDRLHELGVANEMSGAIFRTRQGGWYDQTRLSTSTGDIHPNVIADPVNSWVTAFLDDPRLAGQFTGAKYVITDPAMNTSRVRFRATITRDGVQDIQLSAYQLKHWKQYSIKDISKRFGAFSISQVKGEMPVILARGMTPNEIQLAIMEARVNLFPKMQVNFVTKEGKLAGSVDYDPSKSYNSFMDVAWYNDARKAEYMVDYASGGTTPVPGTSSTITWPPAGGTSVISQSGASVSTVSPQIYVASNADMLARAESNNTAYRIGTAPPQGVPDPQWFPADSEQVLKGKALGFEIQAFHATDVNNLFETAKQVIVERATQRYFGTVKPWTHFGSPRSALERLSDTAYSPDVVGRVQITDPNGITRVFDIPENGRTMPVLLRGNLINVTDNQSQSALRLLPALKSQGIIDDRMYADLANKYASMDALVANDELAEILLKKGIHGVRYVNNVEDPGSVSFVIFNPVDVRSLSAEFNRAKSMEIGLMLGVGALTMTDMMYRELMDGKHEL